MDVKKAMNPCNEPIEERGGGVFYAASQALRRHATGGNVLILATVAAMVAANVPATADVYFGFWQQEMRLQIGDFNVLSHGGHPMTVLQFINDALMAVFFFTIGLEIKREMLVGELTSLRKALLPVTGAVGGMIFPVLIYLAMARGTAYSGGAAIPMATDIAFTLGVLAMLGDRVPSSLKIFLTTLAVVDDIGGIIVIAVFYSGHLNVMYLVIAAGLLLLLAAGALLRIQSKIFYLGVGGVVWFLFLNAGIHPTIAGVLVALMIPSKPVYAPMKFVQMIRRSIAHFNEAEDAALCRRTILSHKQMDWLKQIEHAGDKVISPMQELEDSLHAGVNNFIVPLFAFANAGIPLGGVDAGMLTGGIAPAIAVALIGGKFLGIMALTWLPVKLGWASLPSGTGWGVMAGASVLAGIGFTVSLFIATLTFSDASEAGLLAGAKVGIVVGSLVAGVAGYLMLRHSLGRKAGERRAN